MVVETKEIIQQAAIIVNPRQEHLNRLQNLYNDDRQFIENGYLELSSNLLSLQEEFGILVPAIILTAFKYHGVIRSNAEKGVITTKGQQVVYTGDIPDFAIERIGKAIASGLPYITIHSNQRLPVKLNSPSISTSFRVFLSSLLDPVVMGWLKSPQIVLGAFSGKIKGLNAADIGVVIAMWADDGQPL